jgi:hypothetical protein
MATPIVFLVDGEGSELEALTEALGRRFGIDYQIRGDRSPTGALVTLARLAAGLAAPGRAQPRGAARGRRLLRRGGSRGPGGGGRGRVRGRCWELRIVERDDRGYVPTGRDLLRAGKPAAGWTLQRPPLRLETSLPGVFAAGDVRHGSVKRVATAVGEGAAAGQLVHEYLNDQAR